MDRLSSAFRLKSITGSSDKQRETECSEMMNYSKQSYRQVLERAIDEGYGFVDYMSVVFGSDKRQIILRHDIDHSPTMALEMAEIDSSYSIKATFAVLLSSPLYNPFTPANIRIINEINSLGHDIALHHRVLPRRSDEEIQRDIDKEMQIMRGFFPYIQPVFIWHNLPTNTLLSHIRVPNMVNAYGTKFTQEMHYISDSVARHMPGEFLSVMGKYRLLHILLHPPIWMGERDNIVAIFSHALTRMIVDCDREFLVNPLWKAKFPDGIPEEPLNKLEEFLNKS